MKTPHWIAFTLLLTIPLSAQPLATPSAPVSATGEPSAPAPALPSCPELEKMTVLFDGKTLEGWDCNRAKWSVADGAMRGTGAWCLALTKDDYGSFRLLVTSRVVVPEVNNGSAHLGILFWGERPAAGNYTPRHTGMLNLQPPYGSIWDYGTNKNIPVEHIIPKNDNRLRWHDWHTSEVLANIRTGEIRMAVDGVELMRFKAP
ncbi:MAG TPA: family 16 glycoside hydrolase, partial [Verrucomicrobiae bacterium]|nr:family 16 glycoside hydrolase [Verrucomicrobiae bacterium]